MSSEQIELALARENTRLAQDQTQRGEHCLRQATSKKSLEQALEHFELALREAPAHAPALVGKGRAWLNLATGWYHRPSAASAEAAGALWRALELEPGNATAHALLGAIQHQFEHDWPGAERSFRRAVSLAPQQAFVHSAFGCHLVIHAAFEEAERELQLARQLDPLYINTRKHLVNLRIAQGRLDDAEAELNALQQTAPANLPLFGSRAVIAMLRRDAESAASLYQRACDSTPDHASAHIALAGAHALAGRLDLADALIEKTLLRFSGQPVSPYVRALFCVRRGLHDKAFELMAMAVRERDPCAMQIPHDPNFADVHADPRWHALVAARPFG